MSSNDRSSAPLSALNVRDISGYEIFSEGTMGKAHALAHRMLDADQLRLGHRLIGEWLADRNGSGSDWVHLHFHMAIFELALGEWDNAYARFMKEVLPTASSSADALTDAPALLWRIAITAPEPVVLPWQPLRRTALACMTWSVANSGINTGLEVTVFLAASGWTGFARARQRWPSSTPSIRRSAR
jgi:hypothetical protein